MVFQRVGNSDGFRFRRGKMRGAQVRTVNERTRVRGCMMAFCMNSFVAWEFVSEKNHNSMGMDGYICVSTVNA